MKPGREVRALSRQEPRHEPEESALPRINSAPPDTFPVLAASATNDEAEAEDPTGVVTPSRTPSINSGSMLIQNTDVTTERYLTCRSQTNGSAFPLENE